jgi:hypothetical protein
VWAEVLDTDEGAFAAHLADTFGMEALTERRQVIMEGRVCAACCDEDDERGVDHIYPAPTYINEYQRECCGLVTSSYECPCCGARLF